MLIIGTRPEGIKMMPVYKALKKAGLPTILCSTAQHADLLKDIFELFKIVPDYELNIMRQDQDLFYITNEVLIKTKSIFSSINPSMVIVQGDTTSAMAAALSAFYLKIPIAHVEAGLRTKDIYAPFPEELNRCFISLIAAYHFAPTQATAMQLLAQGIRRETIFCTGNTVVDALHEIKKQIEAGEIQVNQELKETVLKFKAKARKLMLLTAHRRESFNGGLVNIFKAIKQALEANPDLYIIYPMHPNPAVAQALKEVDLHKMENIFITSPIEYKNMVYLLCMVDAVATDSGGIQEEAISLGKHVLVLRQKTERLEGVWAGLATLVGTDIERIKIGIEAILNRPANLPSMKNVYGDGHAGERIATIVADALGYGSTLTKLEKELR